MRRSIVVLLVLAVAVPVLAVDVVEGDAPAVDTFDRHRVAIGFGGGYGKISVGESGVFSETSSTPDDFSVGMAFAMDYDYRVTPEVSIGGFVSGWMGALEGDLGNEDWITTVFGGSFGYRPAGKGFYLKCGFGACSVVASIDDPESDDPLEDYTDYGFGGVGIVGYDIAITPSHSAGPRLEVTAMDVGEGVTALSSALLFTFTF